MASCESHLARFFDETRSILCFYAVPEIIMLVLNPPKLGPELTQKKDNFRLWVLLPDCAPQMLMRQCHQSKSSSPKYRIIYVLTIISPTVLQFLKKCNITTWARGEECVGRPTGYAAIWVVLQKDNANV